MVHYAHLYDLEQKDTAHYHLFIHYQGLALCTMHVRGYLASNSTEVQFSYKCDNARQIWWAHLKDTP
jgi:hypothetical protein